jgi:ATP-binding cassette subfamily B protein
MRVQEAVVRARGGRTLLIVSHKVSSFRRAGRIIVLDAGTIVEQGTHEELLAFGGRYAETFNRQSALLLPGAAGGAPRRGSR